MDRITPRPMVVKNVSAERCNTCDAMHRSVCSAVETHDLGRLAVASQHKHFEKGQTFIEEGSLATDFFNITHGTVKLYKMLPDGRQQITGFAGVGHFLGLAVSSTYAFSAEAIEPVDICRFSRPKLRGLLNDFPALEQKLLETACNELVAAQEQMLLLGRKTARERVASFLMHRVHEGKPCGPQRYHLALPMTRAEIADYLGLTIETISRTLSRFKSERRIEIPSRDEVIIIDPEWMQQLAGGHIEPIGLPLAW